MIGLLCAMESLYSQDESIKKFNYDKSYKNLWNELSFESNNKDIKVNFHEKCMTLSGINNYSIISFQSSKISSLLQSTVNQALNIFLENVDVLYLLKSTNDNNSK